MHPLIQSYSIMFIAAARTKYFKLSACAVILIKVRALGDIKFCTEIIKLFTRAAITLLYNTTHYHNYALHVYYTIVM